MRGIKSFLHDINDVALAFIIVVVAAGIIFWRMQVILDYPEKIAAENAMHSEQQELEEEKAEEKSAEETKTKSKEKAEEKKAPAAEDKASEDKGGEEPRG